MQWLSSPLGVSAKRWQRLYLPQSRDGKVCEVGDRFQCAEGLRSSMDSDIDEDRLD